MQIYFIISLFVVRLSLLRLKVDITNARPILKVQGKQFKDQERLWKIQNLLETETGGKLAKRT